jgi:hypothetical protein
MGARRLLRLITLLCAHRRNSAAIDAYYDRTSAICMELFMKRALVAVAALIALASCASTAPAGRDAGLTFGGPSMFSAIRLIP